jgi:hypothetical protein
MRFVVSTFAAVLLLATVPTEAPAQNLGRILGPLAGPAGVLLRRGFRLPRIHRPRASRSRAARGAYARGHRGQQAVRQAAPAAAAAGAAGAAGAAAHSQAGQNRATLPLPDAMKQPEPFWPTASQDLFDYVLWSKPAGLWAHGYGAVVASMLAQPGRGGERVCENDASARAEAATRQLRERLGLPGDEHSAFAELNAALRKIDGDIAAACPGAVPATVPDRLRAMQDRLWTARVALTNLRGPLQKFYDSLTLEQKARLDVQPFEREGGTPAGSWTRMCQAQTQQSPQWPTSQIARAVRVNNAQRPAFGALSETSSQMSLAMAGSCPEKMPATVVERLDAALNWLDAVLFAVTNIAVPVDDFYRTLSDAQKKSLDAIDPPAAKVGLRTDAAQRRDAAENRN